jgi:succinyl-diaminopimelate desuccinylase
MNEGAGYREPVAETTAGLLAVRSGADARFDQMIDFAQRLIQTPSLPGEEAAIASIVRAELEAIGVDDVWVDGAGNVIGALRGRDGRSLHFNTHLDHVSAGDPALWSLPPFGGIVRDGVLYGRAASDVKGAMAAQVYALAVLRDLGAVPPGDVFFAGVVLEEVGGFGSQFLAREMPTDFAVIGEASNNDLRRGHRGRVFLRVSFTGLSAHASAPDRARNPHFASARFLLALEQLRMTASETFGVSSASPTLVSSDQTSGNVTPGRIDVYVDWRSVPEETSESIVSTLDRLARMAVAEVPGVTTELTEELRDVRTYTGLEATMPSTRGFELPADAPVLVAAQRALQAVFERPVGIGTWTFATDGGHLAAAGIECLGFAPGREQHAHTVHDQVGLDEMREALIGNALLAMTLGHYARMH